MIRTVLALLLLAGPAFAAGDAALATAKATHAKELAKLREQLLADIDKVIKQTDDMGGGIDYMLRERRGFAEVGVTPILPKLQPLSDKYLDAKAAADKALEEAYAKAIDASATAGKVADVTVLKAELKKMRDARQGVTVPPPQVTAVAKATPKEKSPVENGKDAQDDGPFPFLRFAGREDHVELEKTRGALDLQKPFTIEVSARWDTDVVDKVMYLGGDEAWPGMSDKLTVSAPGGWVIRVSKVQDADKQAIEFNIAASQKKRAPDWLSVLTPPQKIVPGLWQHVAVCRSASEIRIYLNGKLAARKSVVGMTLHSTPTNLFVGVRKDGYEGREFIGDVRAFRLSSKVLYSESFVPRLPLKADDTTIAQLDFAAADDSQVPDVSGNKRHGLIVGAKRVKPKQP